MSLPAVLTNRGINKKALRKRYSNKIVLFMLKETLSPI
jgi:hypothetical protein